MWCSSFSACPFLESCLAISEMSRVWSAVKPPFYIRGAADDGEPNPDHAAMPRVMLDWPSTCCCLEKDIFCLEKDIWRFDNWSYCSLKKNLLFRRPQKFFFVAVCIIFFIFLLIQNIEHKKTKKPNKNINKNNNMKNSDIIFFRCFLTMCNFFFLLFILIWFCVILLVCYDYFISIICQQLWGRHLLYFFIQYHFFVKNIFFQQNYTKKWQIESYVLVWTSYYFKIKNYTNLLFYTIIIQLFEVTFLS